MENPVGYLFVVARNRVNGQRADRARTRSPTSHRLPTIDSSYEPGLAELVEGLSELERQVVMLSILHWTMSEVQLLGVSKSSIQTYAERALDHFPSGWGGNVNVEAQLRDSGPTSIRPAADHRCRDPATRRPARARERAVASPVLVARCGGSRPPRCWPRLAVRRPRQRQQSAATRRLGPRHAGIDSQRPTDADPIDLTNQATTEMFVVDATAPSYWRLSALARFDGEFWGLPESWSPSGFGPVDASRW